MTNTIAAQIARKLSPAMRTAMLAGNTADHARGQAASGPTNTLAALVTRELVYPGPGSSLAWTPLGREVARVLDPTVQTLDDVYAEALAEDEARRDENRWTIGDILDVHERAIAEDATRVTIAWRDDAGKTYARSTVDPIELRQTARAIEAYDNLTRILTRAEVRAWLVLHGCSDAALASSVVDLFGKTESELDDMYEAAHGSMA